MIDHSALKSYTGGPCPTHPRPRKAYFSTKGRRPKRLPDSCSPPRSEHTLTPGVARGGVPEKSARLVPEWSVWALDRPKTPMANTAARAGRAFAVRPRGPGARPGSSPARPPLFPRHAQKTHGRNIGANYYEEFGPSGVHQKQGQKGRRHKSRLNIYMEVVPPRQTLTERKSPPGALSR